MKGEGKDYNMREESYRGRPWRTGKVTTAPCRSTHCKFSCMIYLTYIIMPTSITQQRLKNQLLMLGDLCEGHTIDSITDLASALANSTQDTRRLFREVEKAMRLCLSLPESVAVAECSFSCVQR